MVRTGMSGACRTTLQPTWNNGYGQAQVLDSSWLCPSARFLLRTSAALLPADCGQVPCSAGNVEVLHEREQRREAPAKARTPVHFISRSVFHAGIDSCRHGDFRASAAAVRPYVPQGLISSTRWLGGAEHLTSAWRLSRERCRAPARERPAGRASCDPRPCLPHLRADSAVDATAAPIRPLSGRCRRVVSLPMALLPSLQDPWSGIRVARENGNCERLRPPSPPDR